MKNFLTIIICGLLIFITIYNIEPITDKVVNITQNNSNNVVLTDSNDYTKKTSYKYVQLTTNLTPYSYQDLLNIYYTIINSGVENATFYCPSEYKDCIKDVEMISTDELILTHLNNYIHPFNSFISIKTSFNSSDVTLKIKHIYNDDEINRLSTDVDALITKLVPNEKSDYDKIKIIHDYIINTTKYDIGNSPSEPNSRKISSKATGALYNHVATCNGYTDLMAIFLSKLGIDNFKIATTPDEISYKATGHVWNAVKIDNEWRHLDLTWDDPVSKDQKDYLFHRYFLVTTDELFEADKGDTIIEEHNFNKSYYLEFN